MATHDMPELFERLSRCAARSNVLVSAAAQHGEGEALRHRRRACAALRGSAAGVLARDERLSRSERRTPTPVFTLPLKRSRTISKILKNANEGDVKRVWRYQSWESYSPSEQKRRTLAATLQKVATMASSEKEMVNSAMAKLREFADLGYPASVRKDACCRVASSFGIAIWIVVAPTQR